MGSGKMSCSNKNRTYPRVPDPVSYSLTNNMSNKIVLQLNIVVLLPAVFINKHGFEIFSEKVRVGGQIKFEMPEMNMVATQVKNQPFNSQILAFQFARY